MEFIRDWPNRDLPYRPTLGVDAMTSDRIFKLISFDEVNRITKQLRLYRPLMTVSMVYCARWEVRSIRKTLLIALC